MAFKNRTERLLIAGAALFIFFYTSSIKNNSCSEKSAADDGEMNIQSARRLRLRADREMILQEYSSPTVNNTLTLAAQTSDNGKATEKFHQDTKNNQLKPETCEPVKRFAMIKIEKTGSSTMYTILARFIKENKMNMLSQVHGVHIDFRKPRGQGWEIGPEKVDVADTMICHARYNQTIFNKHLHPDVKWVVPVRNAESWIKSAVTYYKSWIKLPNKSADNVIGTDEYIYKVRTDQGIKSWFHLPQLQWLGLPYRDRFNMTAIRIYIDKIAEKIDVPILNDRYDESLVLLRRRFCWTFQDIFYSRQVVTNSVKKSKLSAKSKERLLSEKVNLGDQLLYEKLEAKWLKSPEIQDKDFVNEAQYFSQLNLNVSTQYCPKVLKTWHEYPVPKSRWHEPFMITRKLCNFLRIPQDPLNEGLAQWAVGKDLYKCDKACGTMDNYKF